MTYDRQRTPSSNFYIRSVSASRERPQKSGSLPDKNNKPNSVSTKRANSATRAIKGESEEFSNTIARTFQNGFLKTLSALPEARTINISDRKENGSTRKITSATSPIRNRRALTPLRLANKGKTSPTHSTTSEETRNVMTREGRIYEVSDEN